MANTIPYWGTFSGGNEFDYDPGDTPAGRQFLEAVRRYDPSAQFTEHQRGPAGQNHYWVFSGDMSKVPGWGTQIDINPQAYAPYGWSPLDTGISFEQYLATGGGDFKAPLIDPTATRNDPILGRTTTAENIQWPSDYGLPDILGPLVVGALVAAGATGLLPAWGGAGGAAGGGGAAAGTGAMDISGSTGTGLGGSAGANAPLGSAESSLFGSEVLTSPEVALGGPVRASTLLNAPLGSAESSLYGPGAQTNPAGALGGGTQPAAPIIDRGTPARVGDVIRNGGIPGPSNLWQSATELLGGISPAQLLRTGAGLLGGGSGTGGVNIAPGGGSGVHAGGSSPDIVGLLRAFYGLDALDAAQAMRNSRMRGGYG